MGSFAYVLGRSQSEKLEKLQAQVRHVIWMFTILPLFNWLVHHSNHIYSFDAFCDSISIVVGFFHTFSILGRFSTSQNQSNR